MTAPTTTSTVTFVPTQTATFLSTSPMTPVTWPEFASLHPFVPAEAEALFLDATAGRRGR